MENNGGYTNGLANSFVGGGPIRGFKREEDKPVKKWQLDLLMEKLRQKSSQLKPLADTSKNIRQALMERRCIIDQNDKLNLQKSLDTLQQSIKVNSLQSMVERLEMVARQLGLKFIPGATRNQLLISSDMFFLELIIDPSGMIEDVKIQHEGKTEQQSCPDIIDSLIRTDFTDFTAHLEGLVSIYQLNADKIIKSKAYIALQALEADLSSMASTYSHLTDAETVIMKSLLGLLQPRKGGHPVKLTYFFSPYEFLDVNSKTTLNNDIKTVLSKKLGFSATINIQASTLHKLQMSQTVSIARTPDGKSAPRYGALCATNSTALPACFVLNLAKPIPMCLELAKAIQSATEIESFDLTYTQPILNLVTQQMSNSSTMNCFEQGLFVALPDQTHCYFMIETQNLEGIMLSSVSFTLASQLPQVLAILRQQLAFNTLVGSCVRIGSKPELNHIVFEVAALSHQKLSVSFQHPLDDSLVTLEFDLRDVTHPHCHLHAVANATDIIPTLEEHACRVVKRCMSIPITLRAVIRRWRSMKVKTDPPDPDLSIGVGGNGMNMDVSRVSERTCGAESGRTNSNHPNVMVPPGIMNFNNTLPNSTKFPHTSSYSISPVYPNASPQSPMDILSYMNPFLTLPSPINMSGTPSFPNLTQNMAIQMLASQIGQSAPSQMLMGLLDQVGQAQKRRKRKNTTDNLPSPKSIRPNQSPSRPLQKSPIRRQSDSSDGSGVDKSTMNMLMNELGMDQLPDSRWNIDITPVHQASESMDDLDSVRKLGVKKTTPKRSLSLDSHSSEDIASIQSLMDGQDFKPIMTPSLSITPVSTTSSVNSLLASIRPGIEIIPLPTPVAIPTSLTVTPIMGKSSNGLDKMQEKLKKPKDRIISGKRKLENFDSDGRPAKIPFLDNKGRLSSNMNLTKKPSSPSSLNSPSSKPILASQGKPSVSTLKSVSSNIPKFGEAAARPKIKKPSQKAVKSFLGMGSIPQLKAISSEVVASQAGKADSTVKLEFPKSCDMKMINQPQLTLQQAAANLVNATNAVGQKPIAGKKVGLAVIIDKLKSVHSSNDGPNSAVDKKEPSTTMSTKDYLKVSSAITNDVLQQKKALTVNLGGPGQEYMVKGGQGLKLTINKAKLKDPTKSPKITAPGMKSPLGVMKKLIPGMKPLSALSGKLASLTKKPIIPGKDTKDLSAVRSALVNKVKEAKSPRLESEDLTKKLFLPGSVKSIEGLSAPPIFNPNKFQIPKKFKSNNGGTNSSSPVDPKLNSDSSRPNSATSSTSEREKTNASLPTPTPMEAQLVPQSHMEVTSTANISVATSANSNRPEPPGLIDVSNLRFKTCTNEAKSEADSTTIISGLYAEQKQLDTPSSPDELPSSTTVPIPIIHEFTSPESPDPANYAVSVSTPQTIPTTPLNSINSEETALPSALPLTTSVPYTAVARSQQVVEPPEDADEDQLFIDDGSSKVPQSVSAEKSPSPASFSTGSEATAVTGDRQAKSPEMPPPPPPTDSISTVTSVNSPINSIIPPISPKQIASPLSSSTAIASVHIVHSPQPNSPALLRSPLLVQASPAASPCPIDDDLMDEALIGGTSK